MHPYFDIPGPHLFGHRGASCEAPENTLPAFSRALEHGVPFLELDCHATRDGEIVVLHDAEVARPPRRSDLGALVRQLSVWRGLPARWTATFPFRSAGCVAAFQGCGAYPTRLNRGEAGGPRSRRWCAGAPRERFARVLLASAEPILAAIVALDPNGASAKRTCRVRHRRGGSGFVPRGRALQIPDAFGRRS
jgi:glycerophosphoryl diester phosphodiesterase